jgi:hypothetical protein
MFSKIHQEFPDKNPIELLEIVKKRLGKPMEITHFSSDIPNHSLVSIDVFVQDNGFNTLLSPFTHPITNGTEKSSINFLFQDDCDPGWDLVEEPIVEYLEKQPHVCISYPFQNIVYPSAQISDTSLIQKKLPGIDPVRVCVVKKMGSMLPLNQWVRVVGFYENPLENTESILTTMPCIHCVDATVLSLYSLPKQIHQQSLHQNLFKTIKSNVMGDVLAAEYVMSFLFSQMYSIADVGQNEFLVFLVLDFH